VIWRRELTTPGDGDQPATRRARPTRNAPLVVAVAACAATACAGLQLTPIRATQQRPSNVAVYFKVQTTSGDAVSGLTAESFRVFEDGQLVSPYQSQLTVLSPDIASVHYTLLLVDMSGKVVESGDGEVIPQAVSAFALRVERQQKLAIYAFDGSENLHRIVSFDDPGGTSRLAVPKLAAFKPADPSTNLNGAVVRALDQLGLALSRTSQPLKYGTLVVFADGTDRAGRVSVDDMGQRIHQGPFDVFAIGVAAEMSPSDLRVIGKDGFVLAPDKDSLVKAFDDIGTRVETRAKSHYLLSYCSPSRAGKHEVRIEAIYKDKASKGDDAEKTGSLSSEFDATGFAPGCDPTAPPTFSASADARPDALPTLGTVPTIAPASNRDANRDERAAPRPRPAARPSSSPKPAPESAEILPPPPAPPPAEPPRDFNP
jgi:hypothetical protein